MTPVWTEKKTSIQLGNKKHMTGQGRKKKFQNRSRKCVSKFSNDSQTPRDLNPNHGYMVSEWKVLIKQDTKKPDHPILWPTQGALWHLKVCKLRESYTNSRKNKKMWFTNILDQVIGIKSWYNSLSNNATRLNLISHSVCPRVPRVVSSVKATRKSSLEEVLEHDGASGRHSLQHPRGLVYFTAKIRSLT